ncbi:hypothetical protein EJ05DRAFT_8381 [Pseudovirgaria hyperparasitica]|uniref:Uncharacterized protein n=1 Tax=Pseudovirgaria hyperparasitica TaxID=470096 RepID=A0A6A6WKD9_9PEZI|nr:uncharacterized protein EJ05DRAFT_8381 [Pseudovirgaria hyperparasitica]KAF2762645.1 hypothetical protein EJ05DRAFT_8381 [Pseudovirgaria hyperparasitica]
MICSKEHVPRHHARRLNNDNIPQPKHYNVREELQSISRLSDSACMTSTESFSTMKAMSDGSCSSGRERCVSPASIGHADPSSTLPSPSRISLDEQYIAATFECVEPLRSISSSGPTRCDMQGHGAVDVITESKNPGTDARAPGFGHLRGGADPEPASDPTSVPPASLVPKEPARIPRALWLFAANRLGYKAHAPTINRYIEVEKKRAEKKVADQKKWAEQVAQEALAKAKRKDAETRGQELLRQKGGILGLMFGQVRGGGDVEPPDGYHTPDEYHPPKDLRQDLNRRPIDPQSRVPNYVWYLAGGRGPTPTWEDYIKWRECRRRGQKWEPGQTGQQQKVKPRSRPSFMENLIRGLFCMKPRH